MIAKLRGILDSIASDRCVIDVFGVGYLVFISAKTSGILNKDFLNKEISLTIETVVREDGIDLFGFLNESEKIWFLELTKVQGIGAKLAQKIFGNLTIAVIAKAFISSDVKTFSKIPGIGPKIASRLVTELRESPKKLGVTTDFELNFQQDFTSNLDEISLDAVSALENLGYRRHDCLTVINFLTEGSPSLTLENLITAALRELSKKNLK